MKTSPFAPAAFPTLPVISGVKLSAAACGIKYKDRTDVMVAEMAPGTSVAGVFTKSLTASANIQWGRKVLPRGMARLLIVNSGNANAFNGKAGEDSIERIVSTGATVFNCHKEEIFPSSTGVIGQPLPDEKITKALQGIRQTLKADSWEAAARAIMTTDTFPKGATRTVQIGDTPVTINGIAKGSGMIAPDMATMLSYLFTDAAIPSPILQELFVPCIARSFNSITVDGDTSTSDTALLFATGQAKHTPITDANSPLLTAFKHALQDLLIELAQLVVKDGEGASKFITIKVTGAESEAAARKIGLSIGNSPLVKTAIAGEDANWGRIVMAVGKAGERAERDKMSVSIGNIPIVSNGQLQPGYDETPVAKHMKGRNIDIVVDVGIASGEATVWTCDLTHEYIAINADYRS